MILKTRGDYISISMWKYLVGFGVGVYVGTYYDCRPYIKKAIDFAKEHVPKEKDD